MELQPKNQIMKNIIKQYEIIQGNINFAMGYKIPITEKYNKLINCDFAERGAIEKAIEAKKESDLVNELIKDLKIKTSGLASMIINEIVRE